MLKVALTHDVDRVKKSYQYLTYLMKALIKKDFAQSKYHLKSIFFKRNPYWNFERILEIENKYNIKSTFFFLNESIRFHYSQLSNWKLSLGRYNIYDEGVVAIMKYLDKNGWEIGVHGSYNSFNDKALLKEEKRVLEEIVGHKIIGTRQHYLNMAENTWAIQKELGFQYDSTWGYTKDIGFKYNKVQPFSPFNDKFVVFPLAIMDTNYMSYTEPERWSRFLKIVKQVEKNNGILVLNWHQRVFNEKEFPNFSKEYIKIIEYLCKNNATFYKLEDFYNEL